MKTTIELTASPYLLESINKLLGTSTNLLEAVKLLNSSEHFENNILTNKLNKSYELPSSHIEQPSKDKLSSSTTKQETETDPTPDTIDIKIIRALAKATKTDPTTATLDIKTIRALAKATKTDSTIAPLDIKTIRALAKEKCKTAGLQAVKNLITNLGVNHLESLPQNKYQDLLNQLQAL